MRRLAMLAALVGALVGCSDSTSPDDPVSGRWRGRDIQIGLSLDLVVARQGSAVNGSGTLVYGSTANAVTITGTWVSPNISLVLSSPGFQDTHYGGLLDADLIDGALNGSGFADIELVLSRD